MAREELKKAQSRHKAYFDWKTRRQVFTTGDQVLVLLPTDSNKLQMRWKGLYLIESVVGECDYKVKVNGKVKTHHANLLKRFTSGKTISPLTANRPFFATSMSPVWHKWATVEPARNIISYCKQIDVKPFSAMRDRK